uniref:SEA domain-containing protein n=1 Tax=Poecilia formosa TaxID=48698 RepID=A0A096LSF4_POEFO
MSSTVNITLPMPTSLPVTSQQTGTTSPTVSETPPSTLSPVSQTSVLPTATSPPTTPSTKPTTTTATTTPATTTTTTPAPPPRPKVKLEFKVQQEFKQELTNKESKEFKDLAKNVTSALDGVYSNRFGPIFNRTVIKEFRQGSIVVDSELVFNNETALPNTSDVVETLRNASASPGFNFTVNATSIAAEVVVPTQPPPVPTTATTTPTTANMTSATANATTPVTDATQPPTNATSPVTHDPSPPTTLTTVTPATTPVPADSKLEMTFTLEEPFNSTLETPGSPAFVSLSTTLTTRLNGIYRRRFGFLFLRVLIRAFRQGSIIVDSDVIFANASSVPEPQTVAETLVNESASLNFTLNATSVVVTRVSATTISPTVNSTANATSPVTNATSPVTNATSPVTNATSPVTNATSPVTNATSPVTNATLTTVTPAVTTTAPTTTTTAAPTNPPSATEGFLFMRFGLNMIFQTELADVTSTAFLQLASTVVKEINRICLGLFTGFSRSRVNSFRNGSVIANMTLVFRSTSVLPNLNIALSALEKELLNSNILNYINGSLVLASGGPPLPTMGSLTFFSLIMVAVAQMLINS